MRLSLVSSSGLLLLISFATTGWALEALINSPCAPQCGNNLGSTSAADIVCPDSSYASTQAGQTFNTCITCQLSSTYVDESLNQTDLQWGLYNLRWAMSYCLFGFPNNTNVLSTPCYTTFACGPISKSLEQISVSANDTEYAYCKGANPLLGNYLGTPSYQKCGACLSTQTEQYYLNNFLTALVAGCEQQPVPGKTISIQGSLFTTVPVNITTPSATASGGSHSSGGLSLGAKVGIAIGVILAFLILLGFCIVWNGKRRRKAYLRRIQQESGYDEWKKQLSFSPNGDMRETAFAPRPTPHSDSNPYFDSPADSTRPLQPWGQRMGEEESPATAFGEKAYFTPYTSKYGSPISASENSQVVRREWPVERKTDIHSPPEVSRDWSSDRKGSVVSGSGAPGGKGREDQDEQIELQNVSPIAHHDEEGAGTIPPPHDLMGEDPRQGATF